MGFIILFAGSFWVLFLGLLGISDSTKDRLNYLIAALCFLVVMTVTIPVSVACYAKSRINCCKTQPDSVESNPGAEQSQPKSKPSGTFEGGYSSTEETQTPSYREETQTPSYREGGYSSTEETQTPSYREG